jgi:hypothetical protein
MIRAWTLEEWALEQYFLLHNICRMVHCHSNNKLEQYRAMFSRRDSDLD